MSTMKTTKTRTAVSVALTVLAAGGFLAGFYYYSNRNISSQAVSDCNVDYDRIAYIVEDKISKLCNANTSGGGGDSSSNDADSNANVDLKAVLSSSPSAFECGASLYFIVRVYNMGSDPIPSYKPIKIVIKDGIRGGGKVIAEKTLYGGLEPHEIKNVSLTSTYMSCYCAIHQYCYFTALVDPENTIAETNEDNNITNSTISFRSR